MSTIYDNGAKRLNRLEVPAHLHRNSAGVAARGYEVTGHYLLDLARRRCGLQNLADVSVLDIGCGVRFPMTIINRQIPIKLYSGLDVETAVVDFLNQRVAAFDSRFRFYHWNARNEMYNPNGVPLSQFERLPIEGSFDAIWGFSLFTHQTPADCRMLLRLMRKQIRPHGKLFFSAFIDANLATFEDRVHDLPLLHAYYGRRYMESIITEAGWRVEGFYVREEHTITDSFLCSPR